MNNLQKVRQTFISHGFSSNVPLRRAQFQNFLMNIAVPLSPTQNGDPYTAQVVAQIWEQVSETKDRATIDQLSQVIFRAQNILQDKIFQSNDQIKILQQELRNHLSPQQSRRAEQLRKEISDKQQQKRSFEDDLNILTEPFGINMLAFMANTAHSRSKAGYPPQMEDPGYSGRQTQQVEMKWLFYLCVIFGIIELIVIYQKYDFLNLMVFACLMLIFFMNQLDPLYVKFTLVLLVVSQVLDVIWLFMNSNTYWNLPKVGPFAQPMAGYMKIIIILTFIGMFVKIPLGAFLFHYRNLDDSKQYNLDLPCLKMRLVPNTINPITDALKKIEYLK